jgi:hypothetical protein
MIHLCIIEPVQEVNRPRTGSRQADTHLARKLRMGAGHEGGHFFMAHLNEFYVIFRPIEGTQKAVDPITWISVDTSDTPI